MNRFIKRFVKKGYIDLIIKENRKTYKEITTMMSDKEMLKILENSPAGKKIMEKGVKKGRMQSRRELELQIKQLKAENRRLMAKKAG